MEEKKEIASDQQLIADVILKYFKPGTIENHDNKIEIDNFIDLWAPVDRPKLSEIEKVLELLGFKDEDARIDFMFLVLIKEPE